MPSLSGAARLAFLSTLTALFALGAAAALPACAKKVTPKQCDELLDRFAELVVKERMPDAGPAEVDRERTRERAEAKADVAFKNCTSEVQTSEFACAMKAPSSEALIKCLE